MDYIILYNPLSKGGSNKNNSLKIKRRLEKKNYTVEVGSLIEIIDVKSYIDNLNPKSKLIIVGGDGTLHHLVNALADFNVKNDIYITKAGSGNDFIRSLKTREKIIKINDYIYDIPYDVVEENSGNKRYFLNSAGMGIDAYIAHLVNTKSKGKGQWSYFNKAYYAFRKFKPEAVTVTVDGEKKHFEKTWLAIVANSKYLGKGMKISPKSERLDDELELVVVHGLARFFTLLIFPLIYLGLHIYFKRWVKYYKGKEISIESDTDQHVQYDGEVDYPRRKIKIFRK